MIEKEKLREQYYNLFSDAYKQLNINQKAAVDEIDGPVMVIAGPGTGKTQLLALRVCKILIETDMSAHNILCLTFTDAGALAMRQRLLRFMGPDAYHVGIYTYHSFCNAVIRDNAREFSDYRELQNVSELEKIELMIKLINDLPLDHPIKRLKGDLYYDIQRLLQLFGDIKKEGWTIEEIIQSIADYKNQLLQDVDYLYKRKTGENPAGSVNMNKVGKVMEKFLDLPDAAQLLEKYDQLLAEINRIDFDDSILWVLRKMKENEHLLLHYQERFQYILADEYQDTNGSQNELLFLLSNYDDRPNLFVVGDDDQAIYRFQGANMNNIIEFKEKFQPKEIVLDQNYRSNQLILDGAMELINNNQERLAAKYKHLSKHLQQARPNIGGNGPKLMVYSTTQAQEIGVIDAIHKLVENGVNYKDIAIIYRKHREVSDLVKYFSYKNIPINLKRKVNLLELKEIKRIIHILQYLNGEYKQKDSMDSHLFEILHYDFFGLKANDIGRLALLCSRNTDVTADDIRWRDALNNVDILSRAKMSDATKMYEVNQILEYLISAVPNVTLQVLFERIITSTGLLGQILNDSDKTWRNQVINTFFNLIKEETAKSEEMQLDTFLEMVEKMERFKIAIPLQKIDSASNGIHLMTAHGAKGLEFQHVFILNATQAMWVNKRGNSNYKYPPTLVHASNLSDEEDDRRLFYVAITRAMTDAYICYPQLNTEGKDLEAAQFITEMGFDLEKNAVIPIEETLMNEYVHALLRYEQGKAKLIDKELIDRVLEKLAMSATGVAKYLKCPIVFYFENILRIPMARTANMGYGNAIHHALQYFFMAMNLDPNRAVPSLDTLISLFKKGMLKYRSHFTKEEFESYSYNGVKTLTAYYSQYANLWSMPADFKLEYKIVTQIDSIPISGIIDKIEIYHDHVEVFDYKTGKYDSKKLKPAMDDEIGGEQWRQVVFYKILLNQDTGHQWKMTKAYMDFVEPIDDKFFKKDFIVDQHEIDTVRLQIKEVYDSIKAYKFDEGCNEPECRWCNFVKENMTLQSPLSGDESDSEEYSIGE